MKEVIATSAKNNSGNMCFADFEFTCGVAGRNTSELLSVGIVICSTAYDVLESFYSTVRPVKYPRMTKQCRELTGLTQEEINASPDSEEVFGIIAGLIEKYSIKRVCVWGNFDRTGVEGDIVQHRRAGLSFANLKSVYRKITDIQAETTAKMELPQAVNISELSAAFGYIPENGGFHNALNDAQALCEIHKAAYTTDLSENEKFCRLKQERIEKLAAIKAEQEEKRRQEALSLPLSPDEEIYCAGLSEDGMRRFIGLRYRFVRALVKYPEAERLAVVQFRDTGKIKLFPSYKLSPSIRGMLTRCECFHRDEWQQALLDELGR